MQFEAETRAVSIGKPCRSLRKPHAAVSGISVPSERNLHSSFYLYERDRKSSIKAWYYDVYQVTGSIRAPYSIAYLLFSPTSKLKYLFEVNIIEIITATQIANTKFISILRYGFINELNKEIDM